MDVRQLLHMNGGEGKTSYASIYVYPRSIILKTQPLILEAIQEVLSSKNISIDKFSMADLGCSFGPNSLLPTSIVLDAVHESLSLSDRFTSLEFFAFLNDLPRNDFNSVFRTLPAFYDKIKEEKGDSFGPCFVSGTPGSFYGRLFPKDSLHFVYSANSLHWLSQVPEVGKLNKGNIVVGKTSPRAVFTSYLKQFQKDFMVFLKSRSEEIVSGGRVVLAFMSRRIADPFSGECYNNFDDLADALQELIAEGIVEESQVSDFNMPWYEPHIEEAREVIKEEGSFDIIHLDAPFRRNNADFSKSPNIIDHNDISNAIRAVTEPLLSSHFEKGVIDKLFEKYTQKLAKRGSVKNTFLLIALARK